MKIILRSLFVAALVAFFATGVFAQATRTWVSGVGDDVNPCSRTAPCKTWAGAISKTAEGGEIDALDPGGFGTITITKAITLDGTHGAGFGSILNSGTNGVNVNVQPTAALHPNDAVVILRSLSIQGASQAPNGNGINGINFIRGQRLFVYDCHIQNQTTNGINMNVNLTSTVFVHDSDFTNVNTAINMTSTVGGQVALLEASHIVVQGNVNGVVLGSNSVGTITDSFFARNIGGNSMQAGNGSTLNVTHCQLHANTTAINAVAGSTIRVNENEIFDNSNGFAGNATSYQSGGNNKLAGNTASQAPTGTPLITQ
jgi:hypothetical protein